MCSWRDIYYDIHLVTSFIFFEKKIYFHMRKNQQKNSTNKTMYKRQSKEINNRITQKRTE